MNLRTVCFLFLALIALSTAFFAYRASRLEFDYDFESYFPRDDEAPKFFFEFRKKFGSDNDFIFIALENSSGIFQQEFLQKARSLSDSLSQLKFVENVRSLVSLKAPVVSEMGFFEIPFIHIDDPENYPADSARIFKTDWLVNSFLSGDARALNIIVKNEEQLAKHKSDTLLLSIENLIKKYDFENYHIAGRIHAQHYFLKKMQEEIVIFFLASMVLVMILLYFTFRSAWGVGLPILAIFVSLIWLFGIMQLMGKQLDLMSSILPTIIFVVGMSDVIHITSKYLEEIKIGKEKYEALKTTFKEIGMATFLTSFTTAIGFLSLLTSGIGPIRQFGIYSSLGVSIAFVAAWMVLLPIFYLLKKPELKKIPQKSWDKYLHATFLGIIRYKKSILIVSGVIFLFSFFGAKNIRINNFLLEDISDKSDFKKEYQYFETKFSGARPFEMGVWLKDSGYTFLDLKILRQLESIENYLKKDYGVGALISPLTLVKSAHQALNGGMHSEYRLPESEEKFNQVKKILKRVSGRDELKMVLTPDQRFCRISGKMPDFGGLNLKAKNAGLDSFLVKNADLSLIGYKVTGTAALIDKNNELLSENLTYGLIFAVFIIALCFGLIYKSLKVVLIALIPNILPLVMLGGLMGFMDIHLKISTSMVFTIAFGIAVDDTIHFLSRMKQEIGTGKSWLYAMKRTYISTGKALVLTTIVLSGGFLMLIMSDFTSSFYIGSLISTTLIFALAGDMILLPALLMVFYKERDTIVKKVQIKKP